MLQAEAFRQAWRGQQRGIPFAQSKAVAGLSHREQFGPAPQPFRTARYRFRAQRLTQGRQVIAGQQRGLARRAVGLQLLSGESRPTLRTHQFYKITFHTKSIA